MSENTQAAVSRRIIKKITTGECGATPSIEALISWKNAHGAGAVMPLLEVYGMVSECKPGEGKDGKGPYVKFVGPMIKARNVQTGEIFESGACILPGAAPDLLYGAVQALGENDRAVEFAFKIGAHFDESAIAKYVYDVERVIESGSADPLAALENRMKSAAKNVALIGSGSTSGVDTATEAETKAAKKKAA